MASAEPDQAAERELDGQLAQAAVAVLGLTRQVLGALRVNLVLQKRDRDEQGQRDQEQGGALRLREIHGYTSRRSKISTARVSRIARVDERVQDVLQDVLRLVGDGDVRVDDRVLDVEVVEIRHDEVQDLEEADREGVLLMAGVTRQVPQDVDTAQEIHGEGQEEVDERRDEHREEQRHAAHQRQLKEDHQDALGGGDHIRVEVAFFEEQQADEHDPHQGDVGQNGHQAAEKFPAQELVALHGLGENRVDGPALDLTGDQVDAQDDGDEDSGQRDGTQPQALDDDHLLPGGERREREAHHDQREGDEQKHLQDAAAHGLAERACGNDPNGIHNYCFISEVGDSVMAVPSSTSPSWTVS